MTQPPPYPGDLGPDPQQSLPAYGQQPPPQAYAPPQYAQQPPTEPFVHPQLGLVFPPKPGQIQLRHLHPLGGLATAARVFAIIYAVLLAALALLAVPAEQALIDDFDAYTAYDLVEYVSWAVGIATYAVACTWLHYARENAEMLRPDVHHSRSVGWVWGGWLVPVVNLWFPFQVVRDVLAESNDSRSSSLVGWWWGVFLAACMLTNMADIFGYATSAFAELVTAGALVSLVALVLWLKVIREITAKRSAPQA